MLGAAETLIGHFQDYVREPLILNTASCRPSRRALPAAGRSGPGPASGTGALTALIYEARTAGSWAVAAGGLP